MCVIKFNYRRIKIKLVFMEVKQGCLDSYYLLVTECNRLELQFIGVEWVWGLYLLLTDFSQSSKL